MSLKSDESEGCSPVSGGRTIRLCCLGRLTTLLPEVCVYITAGPIIKLCAGVEGDSEGHVLLGTTSRGLNRFQMCYVPGF